MQCNIYHILKQDGLYRLCSRAFFCITHMYIEYTHAYIVQYYGHNTYSSPVTYSSIGSSSSSIDMVITHMSFIHTHRSMTQQCIASGYYYHSGGEQT